MKKILCAIMMIMMLSGCAYAESVTTELWQHEAGWVSFSVALAQDGMDEAWEEGAKVFGDNLGLAGLSGTQMKQMLMQGYAIENGVDELVVSGNNFTGKTKDGTELFSYEYAWVETLEQDSIMGGTKVYVFQTEEANAGEFTYLLMTEPLKTEGDSTSYVTFNLFHTEKKEYKDLFSAKKTGTATVPCTMIEKDTGIEGLVYVLERLYSQPVMIGQ